MTRSKTSLPNLEKLLAKWQKILRLQDWRIDVGWNRHHEMAVSDTMGTCIVDMNHRLAAIQLCIPIDIPSSPFDFTDWDPEITLVHEILHIPLWPLTNETGDEDKALPLEQVINILAPALVALERAAQPKPKRKKPAIRKVVKK